MSTPSALELLDVWEAGQALAPVPRALALLSAARPELSVRALAEMPIGRRDAELLALRERLFGPSIVALVRCPRCAEPVELSFAAADMRVAAAEDAPILVEHDGYAVRCRPARSVDLIEMPAVDDERALIARCMLQTQRGGVDVSPQDLPDEVAQAVARAMAAADPQADVQVETACPACGDRSAALFDIAAFLWREIEAWARRTLDEVHALASAYGWTEREILTMSATRRRRYVSMVALAS